ncbi:MAG TPA: hypothetical protein VFG54_12325 [Prolixibacteraceae bacterium]|nr:hypothetical protein [Prolixibacteraceae bacterium]
MVQAMLDGRKTMTRREVKSTHHGWDCQKMNFTQSRNIDKSEITEKYKRQASQIVGFHAFFTDEELNGHQLGIKCPFGQPGDILWVRESFSIWLDAIKFKADGEQVIKGFKYKPSIHMPKDHARIWLQVEEIKVERLHEISEDDAISEGVLKHKDGKHWLNYIVQKYHTSQFIYCLHTARLSFFSLWQILANEKSLMPRNNPWVWVVKFKVLSTTGRPETLNN